MIFEQCLIVCIDARAGTEFAQTRIIEQVETKQSSRLLHPELREIFVQARLSVHCFRALENFT